jgi:SAM-dependent methyltransferase
MLDWTDGYVADVGYTFGYYQELNPLRARLPLINAGFIPAENSINCELGFGQGISTNIHAAASNKSWYANDFMPAHALFAKNLANASGANAYLSDEAFVEFCKRPDLPDFDFIGLHGIWSWINEENRKIIVEFIRRKLKVGGVLYVSYNTQPGWAAIAPFRDLLFDYRENMGIPNQGVIPAIERSMSFAEQLFENKSYS